MAEALIREAVAADLHPLLDLMRHLHPEDPVLDPDRARKLWASIIQHRSPLVFLAEEAGSVAASCTLAIIPNLTRGGRPFGIIENVVTHPAHRRRGLGRRVLAFAMDRAWDENCYKIMLATGSTREGTLRFYETCGFTRGGKTCFEARRP